MQAKLYPEYTIAKMPSNLMQNPSKEGANESGTGVQGRQAARNDSSSTQTSKGQPSDKAGAGCPVKIADHEASGSQTDNAVDCCNLLANAPVHGDHYDYHVDADPLTLPDSTWRREFGDYCNR